LHSGLEKPSGRFVSDDHESIGASPYAGGAADKRHIVAHMAVSASETVFCQSLFDTSKQPLHYVVDVKPAQIHHHREENMWWWVS
jgi:hypothetical protein